jgi:hypothetical protein
LKKKPCSNWKIIVVEHLIAGISVDAISCSLMQANIYFSTFDPLYSEVWGYFDAGIFFKKGVRFCKK